MGAYKNFFHFPAIFFLRGVYAENISGFMQTKQRHRGALSKSSSKAVLVYFPKHQIPLIDRAVDLTDTDRSKFIRSAVRQALDGLSISTRGA